MKKLVSTEKPTAAQIRELCLKRKITNKALKELGYTKVYGYRIPLELCTKEELQEAWQYCERCAEEAAFFDNVRKSNLLYDSVKTIENFQNMMDGLLIGA